MYGYILPTHLGFSDTEYGFGAGIFYLGYLLFEIPSLILRFMPRPQPLQASEVDRSYL